MVRSLVSVDYSQSRGLNDPIQGPRQAPLTVEMQKGFLAVDPEPMAGLLRDYRQASKKATGC